MKNGSNWSLMLFLWVASFQVGAQNMVTNEVLQRVFLLRHGNKTGTCFLVSIENNDYLVTARHIFSKSLRNKSEVSIDIFKNDGWIKMKPEYLVHSNDTIDIAVLDLKSNNLKENFFDTGSKSFYLSQECFFLGFPFGLKADDNDGKINAGFPIPFVKRAIVSSSTPGSKGVNQIFLDGHNNPGFSGGPVVITNYGPNNKNRMRIIGVVSAYLDEEKIIKTPFGDFKNGENSGIIVSYGFDHVMEIIKTK